MLIKVPFPSLFPASMLCVEQGVDWAMAHLAPTCDDPCLFLGPLVSGRKGFTWVDVSWNREFPDGVLQGACVLGGCGEVFIG